MPPDLGKSKSMVAYHYEDRPTFKSTKHLVNSPFSEKKIEVVSPPIAEVTEMVLSAAGEPRFESGQPNMVGFWVDVDLLKRRVVSIGENPLELTKGACDPYGLHTSTIASIKEVTIDVF